MIHELSPAVICLQETMLDSNTPCPREYVSYRTPYNPQIRSHGGSLIYVRHDIPQVSLSLATSLEATAVQVETSRRYTVCSLYLPPNRNVSYDEMVDLIRQLPQPFLLLGDMNSRHPLWGDVLSNAKGDMIASVIENEDVGFLNSGEPTHLQIQTGTLSCIDLSVLSANCVVDFSWRTLDDWHTSDHAPIIINDNSDLPEQRSPRWLLEKADWKKFGELSEIEADAGEFQTVDDAIDLLNGTLHTAGVQSIPRSSGLFRRRPVPWWTPQLQILHRATRKALTRLKRHHTEVNKITYKKCRAKFRRAMKEARRLSWSSYVSSINCRTPPSAVWRKLRKVAGKFTPSSPPVLTVNNQLVTSAAEVSNALADHFASVSQKSGMAPGYQYRHKEEEKPHDFSTNKEESYNLPFTEREFDAALTTCNDTAPGPDNIPYAMIKHAPRNTRKFILSIINRIYHDHSYPTVWELAIILAFYKPGKDKLLATSYRPIALTSCVCKIMEKMVNARLVWYLEKKGLLSSAQCGFRRMHSTNDVLIRLESSICEAFASKQHHVTIFFDLEKAYDTAWRYGILKTIHDTGLRGEMPLFIQAFLARRFFQVKVSNTLSERKCQEEGVPQGSVLSVTLFALAINGISSVIPKDILYTLFVDDLSLSFAGAKMAMVERKLQLSVNKIIQWADMNGFKFSTNKTVIVHFCRIRGLHPDPDIYIKGQRIPCAQEARFLGLIFDHRLTWVAHLKSLKSKCLDALNILKVLAHTSWGSDRQTLLRLHKALILSKISYGCEIYSSATPSRLKILDSVHHSGIRLATGAFKSSPIPSILVDAGELPLDLHRQDLICRCWYRLQRLPNSLAFKTAIKESYFGFYETHSKYPQPFGFRVKQVLNNFSLLKHVVIPFKTPIIPPWKLPEVSFCSYFIGFKKNDMIEEEIRSIFMEHIIEHENSSFIFTDGSKSSAGVGFGVSSTDFNCKGALPVVASNYTAELYGVLAALEKIAMLDEGNFTIFSDAKSVLQALAVFNSTNPLVLKILQWLHIFQSRNIHVKFCWVPAHVGIHGNEAADKLAKQAAAELLPGRQLVLCRDLIPCIRTKVYDSWQQQWNLVGPNKMREVKCVVSPWRYSNMPRQWETALCRLRVGHTRLTHGFLMAGTHQPVCEDCIVPLTVRHLLIECPSLGNLRDRFLSEARGEDGRYILAKILGEDVTYNFSGVFKFVVEAGLLQQI